MSSSQITKDMAEEEITKSIGKLNNQIKTESNTQDNVVFTDNAISKFLELRSKEEKQDYNLRLQVIPGGCAGFRYDFSFDKDINKNDSIIEKNNLKIAIDQESLNFVKGSKIDYMETLQETGFKISNPNAQSTCGCGHSFG